MKARNLENNLTFIMWALVLVGLVAGLAVIFLYIYRFGGQWSENQQVWGHFGDYVGGLLGPIFALLALIALLITLRLQSKELRVSSEELRNSAQALAEQSRSLNVQNFENRFFNMLSLHHQIVDAMDLRSNGKITAEGRDCLRVFYRRLRSGLNEVARGDHLSHLDGVCEVYERFYTKNGHELGHYFRNIYRILKYIDESGVENKKDYAGILRAQLSNHELALIFYNGVTHHGVKMKPLATKYALFENMELSVLRVKAEDVKLYDEEAFGDQSV
ncbi:putative phage abortive infection protein [Natronospira bacteriovora]|uniref:Phage abortive infection protein n=1 Tax=Natronospira bacteriovora TaxID=3069753 RepID=A0ABU0W7L3_9GAMM|nr:putative phage abortive infection protein [Natronospira sp. AB-CW4]MDQ2069923.1 putative phage abortive infection protein [Natronospira sp. AB-CW4]